jgi:hypothetical protein
MGRITAALLLALALPADQVDYRIEVAPEFRVGPITARTTRADLDRLFGEESVRDGTVHVGEGETSAGTFVNQEDPARVLAILWHNPLSPKLPSTVRICDQYRTSACRWRTASGITYGTTLKELERLNRRPFRLMGFAWDYGGTVVSWQGGWLEKEAKGCGRFMLRLTPESNAFKTQEWRQVVGDREFSSGHPAMQKLNPRVYDMLVDFTYPSVAGCAP